MLASRANMAAFLFLAHNSFRVYMGECQEQRDASFASLYQRKKFPPKTTQIGR